MLVALVNERINEHRATSGQVNTLCDSRIKAFGDMVDAQRKADSMTPKIGGMRRSRGA
jgi:hypothetical protein